MQAMHAEPSIPLEVSRIANCRNKSLVFAWRKQLGLTQAQMASRLNMTLEPYTVLESRHFRPDRNTLAKVAEALGVQVEQLTE